MIFIYHGDCFLHSYLMLYKVTVPITPMKSERGNPVKILNGEKVSSGK